MDGWFGRNEEGVDGLLGLRVWMVGRTEGTDGLL